MLVESEGASAATYDPDESPEHGDAADRYDNLAVDKYIYLQRARACARVTIPYLFPPQGHSSATNYYTPFQGIGADGVNNLSAKLVLALFPPGEPFFKLSLSEQALKELEAKSGDEDEQADLRGKFEDALSHIEESVVNELESRGARIAQTESVRQLLVAGNALIEVRPDNRLLCHRLENYVIRRDVDGDPVEIIVRQTLKRQSLPPEASRVVDHVERTKGKKNGAGLGPAALGVDMAAADRATTFDGGAVDLFTIACVGLNEDRSPRRWEFHQEIMGRKIPGTDGTWPLDNPGFIPLCWYRIQGEHYGRGFVEEYLGDLNSLEALTQAFVEYAGIAVQVKFGVDETGVTEIKDLANTPNGAFLNAAVQDGKFKDVGVLTIDKQADLQSAMEVAEKITQRLNGAFMKTDQIPRDAERVTAEEIRMLAKALEDRLGGSYSILSQEFQRPLVNRVILNMEKAKKIARLPKGMVRPTVVAGLEGLGREAGLQKLDTLIQGLAEAFGPQAVAQYINVGAYVTRRGAMLGVDMTGLVKSDDQLQQEAQAAQKQDMVNKLGPHMIKAASDQAKSMRDNPNSPVDSQPGGVAGALQQQVGAAQGGVPGNTAFPSSPAPSQ